MYLKHTPSIVKPLAKDLVFEIENDENALFLTFDDGPHPDITPFVLKQLKKYDAHATFFLLGKNAELYPDLVKQIIAEGHSIANHSYQHLSGWKTKNEDYYADVDKANELLNTTLFRPPYGQITFSQVKTLKHAYQIIMWSDLSTDFDPKFNADQCFEFATSKVKPGSIVVFHDSQQAWERLEAALPKCLAFYQKKEYKMIPISASKQK